MAKRRIKEIESIASKILHQTLSKVLPVDPESIAKSLGINVVPYQVSDDISGVLVQKGNSVTIGYNPTHHPVRSRFTIAHELGHFILGHQRGGMFIDRHQKHFSVFYRDSSSSTGEIEQEKEANAFAAALLMPANKVEAELKKFDFDLGDNDENAITDLANTFKVSTQAMSFRIANLGLLSSF